MILLVVRCYPSTATAIRALAGVSTRGPLCDAEAVPGMHATQFCAVSVRFSTIQLVRHNSVQIRIHPRPSLPSPLLPPPRACCCPGCAARAPGSAATGAAAARAAPSSPFRSARGEEGGAGCGWRERACEHGGVEEAGGQLRQHAVCRVSHRQAARLVKVSITAKAAARRRAVGGADTNPKISAQPLRVP